MNPARVITYDGFAGTVREWAQRIPMNFHTLQSRLERGMSLAMALTMPTQRPKYLTPPEILEFQGERATVAQWAARIGLSEDGLRYRLYRGRTLEEALTEPPHKMPARLHQRIAVMATSSVHSVRCHFCKRALAEWKFVKTGVFIGAPICGAPDCVGDQRTPPWKEITNATFRR
jgi:hypothetical protein